MGLLSVSQAPFERALEQPSWAGRAWTRQRRRTAGAKRPRPCPRARVEKVGLAASLRRPLEPVRSRASRPFVARYRYLDWCRRLLNSTAELGAAKRPGGGLSLRPYFLARRPLRPRGPRRLELAACEARRCTPAPLTRPCARATTPHTPCTDPAPPAALTRRLTPPSPLGRSTPLPALLRRCSRQAVGRRSGSTAAQGGGSAAAARSAQAARAILRRGGGQGAALARAAVPRRLERPPAEGGRGGCLTLALFSCVPPMLEKCVF